MAIETSPAQSAPRLRADQADQQQKARKENRSDVGTVTAPSEEQIQGRANLGRQVAATNVSEGTTQTGAGGISGFFGVKEDSPVYTANQVGGNAQTQANKAKIDAMIDSLGERENSTMRASQVDARLGQTGNISQAAPDATAAKQNALLDSIAAAANGQGPSAANATLQSATDRNLAASLAQASAAGGSPAAMRQAAFNRALITQDAAAQSAAVRANEIATARGQASDLSQGIRGQDLATRGQNIGMQDANANRAVQVGLANAGMAQDASKTNLLSGAEQQRARDELIQRYRTQGFTLDEAQRQADIQQTQFNAKLLADQEAARRGVAAQNNASASQAGAATVGAIAATAAAAASDKRAKKNVKDGDDGIGAFLDSLSAKEYDYKDTAKHGEGRRTGIMAQDLEKSDVGKRLVSPADDGTKMVDINKSVMASLAALSNINKRLRELER